MLNDSPVTNNGGTLTTEVDEPPRLDSHRDLRSALMTLPVASMMAVAEEFQSRRAKFREWLMRQFTEGVHYGFPPGCKPKLDNNGNALVWNSSAKKYDSVPKEQWQSKPSLYEAGADLMIDLMLLRAEITGAEDMRSQDPTPNRLFFRCRLFNTHGVLVGEGLGASQSEDENKRLGQPINSAIKIGKKRAKVDAVKNTYGLSDLFTQDTEDDAPPPPPPAPPEQSQAAPTVQPRNERVTADEIKTLIDRFKKWSKGSSQSDWLKFVAQFGGPKEKAGESTSWTRNHFESINLTLKSEGV